MARCWYVREATNWVRAMISGAPMTKARAESLRMIENSLDQAGMEIRNICGRIIGKQVQILCGPATVRTEYFNFYATAQWAGRFG